MHASALKDIPLTTEINAFLETRCKALQLLQNNQSPRTAAACPQYKPPAGAKVRYTSRCNLATQVECLLCKGPHKLFRCDRFLKLQPKQCFTCAKQLGVCFNCLQPFSKSHKCSNQVCRTCSKHHHTLLHMDKTESSS
jgi:hypothetical protein